MTSPNDGGPVLHPLDTTANPALHISKTRTDIIREDSPQATSTDNFSLRSASPSLLSSRSGTFSSILSRPDSPSRLALSFSRFGRSSPTSTANNPAETYDEVRSLIVRTFPPCVAILAADEVDELARRKGFEHGFVELLRPYGEQVAGKVVVRDSIGASRSWDDFGVHFADLNILLRNGDLEQQSGSPYNSLEELMEQYVEGSDIKSYDITSGAEMSPYYKLFMTRLFSSKSFSPHETFSHPVCGIIAISSSTRSPIETLRNLYQQTQQGASSLPPFANPEYLRYYILVHDEDKDDFSKSSQLFDQMKRHFGLHCHLLRLRSHLWTSTDEDAEEVPGCEMLSASEDLAHLQDTSNLIELNAPVNPYVCSSDAVAIRTFVRELVAQSVVPHMEQRMALWNEQIASRRRGISGRIMNISRRWAGIGGSSRTISSAANQGVSGASGNYDSLQGWYRFDTSEALLRKLADYAFMLRDYKLASSTYELLRGDYSNDKAWKYLAGANEMTCASSLLNPLLATTSSKFKLENFDQMLETASYSYLTRCSDPQLALRSIVLGLELLKVRGRGPSEVASKWAIRAVELGLVGNVGRILIGERISSSFGNQIGIGATGWGTRKRKAALWSVMAADEWMKLGQAEIAFARLEDAQNYYNEIRYPNSINEFDEMAEFTHQLRLAVRMKLGQARQRGISAASGGGLMELEEDDDDTIEETTEQFEKLDTGKANRRSLMGPVNPLVESMVPLSPVRSTRPDPFSRAADDDFE